MRVAVTGATGNVGTSVVRALAKDPAVESIVGLARRRPVLEMPKVTWVEGDVVDHDLARHFRGADAVVHLAWLIQPSRDLDALRAVNIDGSANVFAAAAQAGVSALVYASSVGAYSEGPKESRVDESWPTNGIATSFYGRHKAQVERMLDEFEVRHPEIRVVRLRPGLIFKGDAAAEIRRLFAGPFFPSRLARPDRVPFVPDMPRLCFQVVHSDDVAEAYRLAVTGSGRGAYNVAAEPVLDSERLAQLLDTRLVSIPSAVLRRAADISWRLRLHPTPPGWIDLALGVPLMDTRCSREELGWSPTHTATDALLELIRGLHDGRGYPTPPLDPSTGGPFRLGELRTGVGARGL